MNHSGQGRFRAFSAGSFPKGKVHPLALDLLKRMNLPSEGLRSKSWDEFAAPEAPPIDFIFTVCDNAAGEVVRLAREADDGALGNRRSGGRGRHRCREGLAFRKAFKELETRIKLFTSLPIDSLDK